jgi:DNA-directed RNA polymerase specialized sigma24 family protein
VFDEAVSPAPPECGPESRVAAAEQASAVLGQLSGVERYVLLSAKVDGREYAELAGELGRSVAAIKKLASRAMRRLRAADAAGVDLAILS